MTTIENWVQYLNQDLTLTSSGTSGAPKSIFKTEEKLPAANRIAIDAQCITPDSRVLMACRMTNTGCTLAQTLPAPSICAHVDIAPFDPFNISARLPATHT
jgi:hypothetical protein